MMIRFDFTKYSYCFFLLSEFYDGMCYPRPWNNMLYVGEIMCNVIYIVVLYVINAALYII